MMTLLSFLSALASIIYLTVGTNTYGLNKKSKVGIIFLLLTISLSIWSLAYSFAYIAKDIYIFSLWNKLAAIGWCFFPALVLYLVLLITENKRTNQLLIKIMIFLPASVFLLMSVFLFWPDRETHNFVSTFFHIGNQLYNCTYVLITLILLCIWGRNTSNSINKKQAQIIVITGSISFAVYFLTQTVLPALRIIHLPNITQIANLIMLWGIYYAIVKYNFMLMANSLITNELFDEIMDLTFLVDLSGKIIRVNRQVHTLLQYESADFIGTSITDVILEKELDNLLKGIKNITDTVRLNNVNIVTKTGEYLPVNISLTPIRNSKNHLLLGVLIVGQDIRIIENLKKEIMNHEMTTEKLKVSEELFRTVAETIPFGIIFTKRDDNTIFYINKNMEKLFHGDEANLMGIEAVSLYADCSDRAKLMNILREGRQVREQEIIFKRLDDTFFTGIISMEPAKYNDQEVLLSCVADITKQKILHRNIEKSEEMMRKLMDSIPDLVLVSDIDGNINYVNKSIQPVLGYNIQKDVIPDNILDLLADEEVDRAKENLTKILKEDIGPIEYIHRKKDGSFMDAEVNSTILREETGEPFGYVLVSRDITERKRVQETLKRSKEEIEKINDELLKSNSLLQEKSIRDGLTNLYNHQYIIELLDKQLLKMKQREEGLCVMMLDIDHFKNVNDNYGHQVGDMVLNTVSKLIQINIRDIDYAGRYGGEEFLVILPQINMEEAYQISDNIRTSIQNFIFRIKGLKVTISIGLVKYHFEDSKALINQADTLLYRAKENGRNRIEI